MTSGSPWSGRVAPGFQAGLDSSCPPSRDGLSRENCGRTPGDDDDWHSVAHMFITKCPAPDRGQPSHAWVWVAGARSLRQSYRADKSNKKGTKKQHMCAHTVTVLVWMLQCRPACRGWGWGGAPVGTGLCAWAPWMWGSFPGQSSPCSRGSLCSPHSLQGRGSR